MPETTNSASIKKDGDTNLKVRTVKRTLTASAGTNTDTWVVPENQSAVIKSLRVYNPDASARNIKVEILDNNDVVVGALSNGVVDTNSIAAASAFVVNIPRDLTLPAGFKLKPTWAGMTASGALDWEVIYEDVQS